MRILHSRFDIYVIKCKLFKTGNLKLAQLNYKRISDLVNETLKKKITFDINNIFLVIQNLENHDQFIDEFLESIKNTEDVVALKDRQIAFFQKQAELEHFLKDNFSNPKGVTLPT